MAASLCEAFGPLDRAWINTAHQGPLPRAAAEAARLAIEEKLDPRRIAEEAFFEVPHTLRGTLGRLVGADPREIVLANSTSYGLDLLAHGLPLQAGDEVLLVEGDFPASIYPWLPLQRRGVRLRTLPASSGALEPDDLQAALSDRTRVVCTSWAFSFTGRTADVRALVDVCRQHGDITFVLNGSQSVGARPTDVYELGMDALVSCGFKWLCGPYATGFTWLRPQLLQRLEYEQGYWLAQVDEIASPPEHYELRGDLGARRVRRLLHRQPVDVPRLGARRLAAARSRPRRDRALRPGACRPADRRPACSLEAAQPGRPCRTLDPRLPRTR